MTAASGWEPGPAAIARSLAFGSACAMRAFSGPAALALRGRLGGETARRVLAVLEAGELIGDKNPKAPSRSNPPSLIFRTATGAISGQVMDGPPGALIGGVSACTMTFLTERARRNLGKRLHAPDLVIALAEDAIMIATTYLATGGQAGCSGTAPSASPAP